MGNRHFNRCGGHRDTLHRPRAVISPCNGQLGNPQSVLCLPDIRAGKIIRPDPDDAARNTLDTCMNSPDRNAAANDSTGHAPAHKAGPLQVAATMFCGIFAIGAKGTWHRAGATVTFRQVIIGAALTLLVLILILAALVALAVR